MVKSALALRAAVAACALLSPGVSAWNKESLAASRKPAERVSAPTVPGKYIVELEPGAQSHRRGVESRATTLLGDMRSKGYDAEVKTDYSTVSSRFQGVSVEITNDKNATIDDIKAIPGVVDVWPVYSIALDDTLDTSDASPQWNPHISTRVDELHKRGYTGSGARVCVVDSGVDASHDALSGAVAGGRNLIEDNDDFSDCLGHGTFVSSVIAGHTKDFSGVAPSAQVFMYKIFGCEDSVSNDLVLKGLLAADADDCDIVSLSLGSDTGYSGSILSRVASEIAQDRVVIIAAGNSGEVGPFYASSPASGRGVISVGSTDSLQVMGWPATIVSSTGEIFNLSYVTPDGSKLNEAVSAPVLLDSGDSCNPEEYGSEEQAVVVKRGICFPQKAYNRLGSTGFGYYLIFDSYNQGVYYQSDVYDYMPSVHLFAITDAEVGVWVKEQLDAGNTLTLEIEADANPAALKSSLPNAGQMSYFSSWGPSFENDFSPSVSAPGGAVYGAYPNGVYAVGSGTSFATPYVAGVAALFYAHVKKDHQEFSRRLLSTATFLSSYNAAEQKVVSTIAPLIQQGAGLVDAAKIFDYKVSVASEPLISLNDTDNRVSTHTIRLQNAGSEAVTFKVSHVAASTVQSRDEYLYPYEYFPPLLAGVEGSIDAPESITVAAGATQEVTVTFNSPANADKDSGAVWSGKVIFQGDNDEALSVPYVGVEASTYNWTPLEGSPLAFRYDQNTGYLYDVDWQGKPYKPAELDSPEIYYALRYGSYEFSLDLVGDDYTKKDFSYPLKTGPESDQWRGSLRTQPDVFGGYADFPSQFGMRINNVGFVKFQSFSNGTEIPSGRYRLLSRALRMFGDASNPSDWQIFLSDPFSIQLNDDPIPGANSTTTSSSSTAIATSTEATTTMQTTISATTTATLTSTAAPISVPGITTTLKPTSTPTGLPNAFVDLSIHRQGTSPESSDLFDTASWLELHVQIYIPMRLPAGADVVFALPPQIVDVAVSNYVQAVGSHIGSALFDTETGLFTVALNDWVTWHSEMRGDFYLACRIDPAYQAEMAAGTYVIEMETVGETFGPAIYYRAVDRSRVYESVRELDAAAIAAAAAAASNSKNNLTRRATDEKLYEFAVEVPGSLGPWESVAFLASQASTDDGFRCEGAGTGVFLGTRLDESNRIAESTDVSGAAVERCDVKVFKAVYEGAIAPAEVLRFNAVNMMGQKGSGSIAMAYSLAIALENGTTVGYSARTVTYDLISRARPDNFFEGVVDRDGPIAGETSTTSTATSVTSTGVVSTETEVSSSVEVTATSTAVTSTVDSTSVSTTDVPTSTDVSSTETSTSQSSSSTVVSSTAVPTVTGNSTATVTSSGTVTSVASSTQTSGTESTVLSSSIVSSTGSTAPVSSPATESTRSSTQTQTGPSQSNTNGPVSSELSTVISHSSTASASDESSRTSTGTSTSTRGSSSIQSQPTHLPSSSSGHNSTTRPHPSSTAYVTDIVTVITTVCTDPSWTAPVTVTYTVPCETTPVGGGKPGSHVPITTVTSTCTVCADHPVTLTYTQPVLVPGPTGGSGGGDGERKSQVVSYGSRTVDLASASRVPNQPTGLSIPTMGNVVPGGVVSSVVQGPPPAKSTAQTSPGGGKSGEEAPSSSETTGEAASTETETVVAAGASVKVGLGSLMIAFAVALFI